MAMQAAQLCATVLSPDTRPARRASLPGRAPPRFFGALVHVAEALFEIEHLLAHRLEAEVSGLDDAGMHRPDRNLVYTRAVRE
jgi:hypothetical protein